MTCICKTSTAPCHNACTCANPLQGGGCHNCRKYGVAASSDLDDALGALRSALNEEGCEAVMLTAQDGRAILAALAQGSRA